MGEVIDFTEKFKQKPKPKEPEPDAEASTEVGDELLPSGQNEFGQAEPGIKDERQKMPPQELPRKRRPVPGQGPTST